MSRVVLTGARALIAVAIAFGVFFGVYRYGFERYRINVLKRQIEHRTLAALEHGVNQESRRIAAGNIRATTAALRRFPTDPDLYLELGANYRLIGNYAEAERTYRKAMTVSRRPEVFLNLGNLELHLGDVEGAIDAFAPLYRHNPAWLDEPTRLLVESRIGPPERGR